MNALSTIAEAVKTALAAQTFIPPADSVERVYVPEYGEGDEGDDDNGLKIFVVMPQEKADLFGPNTTRAQCEHDYTVRVAVMKRIEAGDVTSTEAVAEIDGLSDLRESVIDFLKSNRVMGNAALNELANSPTYDPALLDTKGIYCTVINLVYRLLR